MIILFGSTVDALAQQDSFCLTQPVPYYLPNSFSMGDDCFEGPYTLRVYLHIVRNSDGSGGISVSDAMDCLDVLNEDFEDHNISFFTDCEPDEIRNDDYTTGYSDSDLSDIFQEVVKHDGINIFLFPSDLNPGIFGYGTLPGDDDYPAASIAGSFKGSYSGLTHIISHELGHVLGLYHTNDDLDIDIQGDCFENYPGEGTCGCSGSCAYDGDLICDTYPDPFPFGNYGSNCVYLPELVIGGFAVPIQTWCYEEFPIPDYTTPVTNIMALWQLTISENCWAGGEFTFCQGLKMRKVVEEYGTTHGFLAEPNPAFQTYTITGPGTTNWTQENVNGIILVEAEAVLTITDRTVCFTPESRIYVSKGGKLVVTNSTLRSQCADKWQGIEVHGNGAAAQVNESGTLDETTNGVVVIQNGSTIRDALTGVRCGTLLYNYKAPLGQGKPYFDPTLGGGYLKATDSNFEENDIAVHFGNYDKFYENQSIIENCEISFEGTQLSGNKLAVGVKIISTGEIEISGSSFTGQYMIGVDLVDGMVLIHDECSFVTGRGVYAFGTTPSAGWVDIKGASQAPNVFSCKLPVEVHSLDLGFGARIVYNEIDNQYAGILISGPTSVNVARNQVESEYASALGIWLGNACLSQVGNVYCNPIDLPSKETIHCVEDNSLLLIYKNQVTVDDPISAIINEGEIFHSQVLKGTAPGNFLPVGNVFSTPATFWISNSGGIPFSYYIPEIDLNGNLIPIEDNFTNVTVPANPPTCPSLTDPIVTPDEESRGTLLALRDSLWAEWSETYSDTSILHKASDAHRDYMVQFQAQEQLDWANRDTSDLMALWAESTIPGQWKKFGYIAQSGGVSNASGMLNNLVIPYLDTTEFQTLQTFNLQRLNQDTSFFTISDSIWVDQVARSLSPNAGYARGLLHAIYDWNYLPDPEAEPRSSSPIAKDLKILDNSFACQPILIGGLLNLGPCLQDSNGEEFFFTLMTGQGQQALSYVGTSSVHSIKYLPTGVYFFRLVQGGQQVSGKIWVP